MEHRVNNRAVSIERKRGASHGTYTAHMRQFVGRWGAKMGAPFIVLLVLLAMSKPASAQDPPFRGTVFDLSSNLLNASDPSSLRTITYAGEAERDFLETRDGEPWKIVRVTVHVFDVEFDRKRMEFQVHLELGGPEEARTEVDRYALMFGRLPWALRERVREVEIQAQGARPSYGHGYDWTDPRAGTVTVHTGAVDREDIIRRGFMEEIFMHEGAHTSWDPDHEDAPGWRAAQRADGTFISDYARDYPDREDVAETVLAWFALYYQPHRVSADRLVLIRDSIPHRLAYFDAQNFDMSPYRRVTPVPALSMASVVLLLGLLAAVGVRMVRRL